MAVPAGWMAHLAPLPRQIFLKLVEVVVVQHLPLVVVETLDRVHEDSLLFAGG